MDFLINGAINLLGYWKEALAMVVVLFAMLIMLTSNK